MKRKKEEIDVYIEQVAAKEKDGEYDTRDICGQKFKQEFQNKRMQTAQEAGKFEIHQLLFKGQPTGYARCSSQKCRDAMWMKKKIAVFQINPYKTQGAKWQLLERHLKTYHSSAGEADEAASSSKTKSGPQQSKLNVTTKGKKLPLLAVQRLRKHNINIAAKRRTSLNFFAKDEVREKDQELLELGGYDPNEVYRFDRTGPTVKKDLERNSRSNKELIADIAPKLAEEGVFALAMDHMEIKNMKNQKLIGVNLHDENTAEAVRPTHALGMQLIISVEGGRKGYMLGYSAVPEKTNETTLKWAREILQESAK